MHRTINITLKAAAAILAVILAASCVFEKEEPSQTQQKYKYVLVQLGVNTDKMTATKADGNVVNASDADGNDVETAIKDLRVYAYTNEKKDGVTTKRLCGYLYAEDVDAAETSGSPLLMDIKVPFEEYEKEQTVYFMAVANAGGMTGTGDVIINSIGRAEDGSLILPSNFGFDDFAGIKYSVADQTFANGMPMYCQTNTAVTVDLSAEGTPNTEPGHNGHTHLPVKVTLDMTRSLSKIEVYAAEDAGQGTSGTSTAGIQITGVELMNVIADGPLFPAAASTTTLTTNPTLAGNAVALSASAADKADPAKYTKVTSAYYLAENAAGVTGKFYYGDDLSAIATTDNLKAATTLKIGYKVGTSGDQKYGYVIMPQIERNTWYKVLARITAGGELSLTFVVQPWNKVEESLVYSDQVSVTEGKIVWNEGSGTQPNNSAEIVTNGNDIKCQFTIATPRYATWHASFSPVSGDVNAFGFVNGSEVETTATGEVGKPANLTIRPLGHDLTQNNVAILRVIVKTNEGRTIVVKNSILSGKTYNNDEFRIIHSK